MGSSLLAEVGARSRASTSASVYSVHTMAITVRAMKHKRLCVCN